MIRHMIEPHPVNCSGAGLHALVPPMDTAQTLVELDLQITSKESIVFLWVAVNDNGEPCDKEGAAVASVGDAHVIRGEFNAGNLAPHIRSGHLGKIPAGCGLGLWIKAAGTVCGSLAVETAD